MHLVLELRAPCRIEYMGIVVTMKKDEVSEKVRFETRVI
jgi:hypothetical protein